MILPLVLAESGSYNYRLRGKDLSVRALFAKHWDDYASLNPSVNKIRDLFVGRGENVVNDHIALRTFDDPKIDICVLGGFFEAYGYERKGEYVFEDKHLKAAHWQHPDHDLPRVFISQLTVEKLSPKAQSLINDLVGQIDPSQITEDFLTAGILWAPVSFKSYQDLLAESEYAAWMSVWGFRANHFTVSINNLTSFDSIEEVNDFLKSHDFVLNQVGGEIKGSSEVYLEQSSTMADKVSVELADQTADIPCCFYEFAFRHKLPDGSRFNGFVAGNADKIFESTHVSS